MKLLTPTLLANFPNEAVEMFQIRAHLPKVWKTIRQPANFMGDGKPWGKQEYPNFRNPYSMFWRLKLSNPYRKHDYIEGGKAANNLNMDAMLVKSFLGVSVSLSICLSVCLHVCLSVS